MTWRLLMDSIEDRLKRIELALFGDEEAQRVRKKWQAQPLPDDPKEDNAPPVPPPGAIDRLSAILKYLDTARLDSKGEHSLSRDIRKILSEYASPTPIDSLDPEGELDFSKLGSLGG